MSTLPTARTYNQEHVARKYTPGKRRVSIYWTWSYPWESQRDLMEMDNRFSTMAEVRRVVTGHDPEGRSVFVADEPVAPLELELFPGWAFHPLWGGDATQTIH